MTNTIFPMTVASRHKQKNFAYGPWIVVVLAFLTGCSGAAPTLAPQVFDVKATAASLQAAGWMAQEAPGMPDTLSKFKQTGYLETTAPDGQQIDMQFMEDGAKAGAELAAVLKQAPAFKGTTIGNVMVFSHPTGDVTLPASDLDALRKSLK